MPGKTHFRSRQQPGGAKQKKRKGERERGRKLSYEHKEAFQSICYYKIFAVFVLEMKDSVSKFYDKSGISVPMEMQLGISKFGQNHRHLCKLRDQRLSVHLRRRASWKYRKPRQGLTRSRILIPPVLHLCFFGASFGPFFLFLFPLPYFFLFPSSVLLPPPSRPVGGREIWAIG